MNNINNGMGFGQSNNMFRNNDRKIDNKNNSMIKEINGNISSPAPNIDKLPFEFKDAVRDLLSTEYFSRNFDPGILEKNKQLYVNINDSLGFKRFLVGKFKKFEVLFNEPLSGQGGVLIYDILFEADSNSGNEVRISGHFDPSSGKWISFMGPLGSRDERLTIKLASILDKKNLSDKCKDALFRNAQCLMSFLNVRFLFPVDKWFDNNGVHNNVKLEMGSWNMKFQRIEVKTISSNSCELEFYNGTGTSNNSIEFAKVKATLNYGSWNLELKDIR